MGWLSFKMLNKCQFAKESQYRLHKFLLYVANLRPKITSITLWLERSNWLDLKKYNDLHQLWWPKNVNINSCEKFVDFRLFSKYLAEPFLRSLRSKYVQDQNLKIQPQTYFDLNDLKKDYAKYFENSLKSLHFSRQLLWRINHF